MTSERAVAYGKVVVVKQRQPSNMGEPIRSISHKFDHRHHSPILLLQKNSFQDICTDALARSRSVQTIAFHSPTERVCRRLDIDPHPAETVGETHQV